MNDRRFKELLNLYLDHRLDGADIAEFEAALRADASRRKMLRDYALLNGGCNELFARAAAQAPSSATLCRSLRAVESRISRVESGDSAGWVWQRWSVGFGVAGIGLAACATVLVFVREGGPVAPTQEIASVQSVPAPKLDPVAEPVVTPLAASVATNATPKPAVEVLSERQKARNLTLAALGLTTDQTSQERSEQRWADAHEAYELANLSPSARSWIRASAASESGWTHPPQSSFSMQTSAGYSWSTSSTGGYQVQAAAYRFER
jgi:hypothetical protein